MHLDASVYKAYDIRGIVPRQINPEFAFLLGRALGRRCRTLAISECVVGFDGRHSSPELASQLSLGLQDEGIIVIALGMVPTPLVYFETYSKQLQACVAITGSHNPPDYNGFKIMLQGKAIYGEQVASLYTEMQALQSQTLLKLKGSQSTLSISPIYIKRIADDIQLARPMKIAIDCGNGVGGVVAADLYRALGCEVDELHTAVDANFPNHHPDPADPHNLEDLIAHVQQSDCELGLAFDGDADRLGVVTKDGQVIWPDRQLILFSRDVLNRVPGATIVFDVKCSRHVEEQIRASGGHALMWQTGHSLIKAKMKDVQAALGGEMSGHIFFQERWYGFDDGLYTGARLLEIVSRHENSSAILNALPQDVSTPELKLQMAEGQPHSLIKVLQEQAQFPTAQTLIKIDGVRAEYAEGFGLARASNTTPVIVLRFEGKTQSAIRAIQDEFKQVFQQYAPELQLPF